MGRRTSSEVITMGALLDKSMDIGNRVMVREVFNNRLLDSGGRSRAEGGN